MRGVETKNAIRRRALHCPSPNRRSPYPTVVEMFELVSQFVVAHYLAGDVLDPRHQMVEKAGVQALIHRNSPLQTRAFSEFRRRLRS